MTMAWRNRNALENGSTGVHEPILPANIWVLSSDVVDIEGVPSDLTYAMQMSYENVNTYFDGPTGTSKVLGSYLAKWNPSGNGGTGAWVNAASLTTAGSDAQTPLNNLALSSGTVSLSALSWRSIIRAVNSPWRNWSGVGESIWRTSSRGRLPTMAAASSP